VLGALNKEHQVLVWLHLALVLAVVAVQTLQLQQLVLAVWVPLDLFK
jgi:hypothetical protein